MSTGGNAEAEERQRLADEGGEGGEGGGDSAPPIQQTLAEQVRDYLQEHPGANYEDVKLVLPAIQKNYFRQQKQAFDLYRGQLEELDTQLTALQEAAEGGGTGTKTRTPTGAWPAPPADPTRDPRSGATIGNLDKYGYLWVRARFSIIQFARYEAWCNKTGYEGDFFEYINDLIDDYYKRMGSDVVFVTNLATPDERFLMKLPIVGPTVQRLSNIFRANRVGGNGNGNGNGNGHHNGTGRGVARYAPSEDEEPAGSR